MSGTGRSNAPPASPPQAGVPRRVRARFALTEREEQGLHEGSFVRAALPEPLWMPDGNLATSVLVGRVKDTLVAYVNLCRHHPMPLDEESTTVMSQDGLHLLCHTHGALYRPTDGYCVSGPCMGQSLFSATAKREGDRIVVEVP